MNTRKIEHIISALHRAKYGTGNPETYGVGYRKTPFGQCEGTFGHQDPIHPHRPVSDTVPSGVNGSSEGTGAVSTQGRGTTMSVPNPQTYSIPNSPINNQGTVMLANMGDIMLHDYLVCGIEYELADTPTIHLNPFYHQIKYYDTAWGSFYKHNLTQYISNPLSLTHLDMYVLSYNLRNEFTCCIVTPMEFQPHNEVFPKGYITYDFSSLNHPSKSLLRGTFVDYDEFTQAYSQIINFYREISQNKIFKYNTKDYSLDSLENAYIMIKNIYELEKYISLIDESCFINPTKDITSFNYERNWTPNGFSYTVNDESILPKLINLKYRSLALINNSFTEQGHSPGQLSQYYYGDQQQMEHRDVYSPPNLFANDLILNSTRKYTAIVYITNYMCQGYIYSPNSEITSTFNIVFDYETLPDLPPWKSRLKISVTCESDATNFINEAANSEYKAQITSYDTKCTFIQSIYFLDDLSILDISILPGFITERYGSSSGYRLDDMFFIGKLLWQEIQSLITTDKVSMLTTTHLERSFQKAYTGKDTTIQANPFIIPIGITIQRFSDRVFIKKEE